MANLPQPIIHVFQEINDGKFKSVRHYELIKVENGNTKFSTLINISKDRQFAKSNPDYWVKIRQSKKWSKPITGLFKTNQKGIFKGDLNYKKNLIIVKFEKDTSQIIIHCYDYYTTDLSKVLNFITE